MRAPLALLLIGLPGLAVAQTTGNSLTLDLSGQTTLSVTPNDCDVKVTINWTASVASTPCGDLVLWLSPNQCTTDAPTAGTDYTIRSIPQDTWVASRTGSEQVSIQNLPIFSNGADGGLSCGQIAQQTVYVCGAWKYGSSIVIGGSSCSTTTAVKPSDPPTIIYDGQPPDPPSVDSIDSLDNSLQVNVTASSDSLYVHMQYRAVGDTDWQDGGSFSTDRSSGKISGLTNGVTYEVRATGEDAAGNISDPSNVVDGTPQHTEGFFDRYIENGGAERGGCTAGSGGLWTGAGVLLLAGFLIARRRRG